MRVHTPIFERVGTASGDFADDRCAFQRLKIIGERLGGRESALAGQDIERLRVAEPARPGRRGRDVSRRLATRAVETAAERRPLGNKLADDRVDGIRSEEHTSELQSLMRISYAVFCLQKKKHT